MENPLGVTPIDAWTTEISGKSEVKIIRVWIDERTTCSVT